ncbi:MAG: hypothetical protein SGPRY_004293 [Prymnesium sp.]
MRKAPEALPEDIGMTLQRLRSLHSSAEIAVEAARVIDRVASKSPSEKSKLSSIAFTAVSA